MTDEFKQQLCDFWEPWELVDFARLPIEEVVDAFEDQLEEVQDELEEFMNLRTITDEKEDE